MEAADIAIDELERDFALKDEARRALHEHAVPGRADGYHERSARKSNASKMSVFDLYRASPLAVIGNCLTGMAHGTIFGLGAIYASVVLVELKLISLFMACFLMGSLVSLWPVGYISDLVGRRPSA